MNKNITLINCTIIVLSFNETSNKITVVYNPHKQTVQLILIRRNIQDKSISTLEVTHIEMILTNACFDSLFES